MALKATLISLPDPELLSSKNHKVVQSRAFRAARHRPELGEFARHLEYLMKLRAGARYLNEPFGLTTEEAKRLLATTERLVDLGRIES